MCVGRQSSPGRYWRSGLSFIMSFKAPLSSCRLNGVGWHLVTKSNAGVEHVSNSPSGSVTLSLSIPTKSFSSGVGMMYCVPVLPTCIPSLIISDSIELARSGTYRKGMSLFGPFSSSLLWLTSCGLSLVSLCGARVVMLVLQAHLTMSSGFSVLISWLLPCCLVYI